MTLRLQPIRVRTASDDEDGQLVLVDEALVAVLVRLAPDHGAMAGHWYLEAGFGQVTVPTSPTFPDLDAALAWIAQRLHAPY
ncbi:hypothetical protein [Methylobacterium flocculans]|uniref:hypothetical protein n=1 Tax=Methylobacterium flocculans TaxID=2984843 RepID=UPI0021F292FB|nr:hypothetical protein [Methylobacterium sp. FF17]